MLHNYKQAIDNNKFIKKNVARVPDNTTHDGLAKMDNVLVIKSTNVYPCRNKVMFLMLT